MLSKSYLLNLKLLTMILSLKLLARSTRCSNGTVIEWSLQLVSLFSVCMYVLIGFVTKGILAFAYLGQVRNKHWCNFVIKRLI